MGQTSFKGMPLSTNDSVRRYLPPAKRKRFLAALPVLSDPKDWSPCAMPSCWGLVEQAAHCIRFMGTERERWNGASIIEFEQANHGTMISLVRHRPIEDT